MELGQSCDAYLKNAVNTAFKPNAPAELLLKVGWGCNDAVFSFVLAEDTTDGATISVNGDYAVPGMPTTSSRQVYGRVKLGEIKFTVTPGSNQGIFRLMYYTDLYDFNPSDGLHNNYIEYQHNAWFMSPCGNATPLEEKNERGCLTTNGLVDQRGGVVFNASHLRSITDYRNPFPRSAGEYLQHTSGTGGPLPGYIFSDGFWIWGGHRSSLTRSDWSNSMSHNGVQAGPWISDGLDNDWMESDSPEAYALFLRHFEDVYRYNDRSNPLHTHGRDTTNAVGVSFYEFDMLWETDFPAYLGTLGLPHNIQE